MTTAAPSTALATIQPAFTDAERLALAGFLAGNWIGLPEFVIPDVHSVAAGGQGFLCQVGSGIQGSAWAARVRASRAPMPWRAAVAR